MESKILVTLFDNFIDSYDEKSIERIWIEHSRKFREFWNNRIMSNNNKELNDQEIDDIVKILDRNGKGNKKGAESVAKIMIPQGAWRRMFNELHSNVKLKACLDKILFTKDSKERSTEINKLYKINTNKNSLTGKSGNAINALLVACEPFCNLSIVSLNDRAKLISYFGLKSIDDLNQGEKIVESNRLIADYFEEVGIKYSARVISNFCYSDYFKNKWKNREDDQSDYFSSVQEEVVSENDYLFVLEKHLEDFIIENWDNIELGKRFELIDHEGDMVSQQYRTDIGIIDILAIEKKSGKYVIIELKRNQTSDDTIGQLCRYMAWVEENLSNGKESKGIIITGKYDKRLDYAARKIRDVEMYIYKIDFKLGDFEG